MQRIRRLAARTYSELGGRCRLETRYIPACSGDIVINPGLVELSFDSSYLGHMAGESKQQKHHYIPVVAPSVIFI
jgi:hypothetical protein